MTGSQSRENSRSFLSFIGIRSVRPLKVATLEGYSIRRVLLVGLIFPVFVAVPLLTSLSFARFAHLSSSVTIVTIFAITMTGFVVGTLVLLKMADFIVRFAKVKRQL